MMEGAISFLKNIFGGSDQKQESGNKAYPWVQQTFEPRADSAFNGGLGGIQGLLGLGGDPGASKAALDNFWKSTGGDFLLKQGTDQINANMYSRGLGQSGADMKGLENYRSGLASTKLNDMLQNYFGLAKLGLGAGSLVSDAGQYSKGKGGSSSGGLGSFLGAALAFI